MTIVFVEQSVRDVSVNEYVQDLGFVILGEFVELLNDQRNLESRTFSLESRSTNTVSVNDDLLWQSAFVHFTILLKRF